MLRSDINTQVAVQNVNWTFVGGRVLSFDIFPWQLDTFWSQTNQATLNYSECLISTVSICFFHCQESVCVLPTITKGLEHPASEQY